MPDQTESIVIGSGPNGLFAAAKLARAGLPVRIFEARATPGGGTRTEEVTLPGFLHDICSAIHPTALVSPAFRELELEKRGLEWIWAPIELAHPFDDGSAAVLRRSVDETAAGLGADRSAWIDVFRPLVEHSSELFEDLLRPIRLPRHPGLAARFGFLGLRSVRAFASRFQNPKTRAIFAGCAAHAVVPLHFPGTASFGLVLALSAHAAGWPCARGGSVAITNRLLELLSEHGVSLELSSEVRSIDQLPGEGPLFFDVTPRQLLAIAGERFPRGYREQLGSFRYGPGIFKIDWALSGPVPWTAPECRVAATIHLGGTYEEIAESELAVWEGRHAERPFILFAQQSLFDPTRAPEGKQTGWAYCHVPHGSTEDMTDRVENQIERFAPGFRDLILGRKTMTTGDVERHNPNMIGGDIGGGANDLAQFLMRPFIRWNPYTTPDPRIFLCSASTPPGGGVHGMCGFGAVDAYLARP
ncbi:MAG TPA: NAD(P)/FAD-dependent oxidoreductase [Thermoanaerobaculia bacterium]|nr:NAD(P)/FAD-dependent oxidoreductase [Thermoanaerobaculia bacterium]